MKNPEPTLEPTLEKPVLGFDRVGHIYTLDGRPLTGVTTILGCIAKPFLIQWAADMACDYMQDIFEKNDGKVINWRDMIKVARSAHRKKKEAAGKAGTDVHEIIEEIIKDAIEKNGGFIKDSSHENKQVAHFLAWSVANSVEYLASEKQLFSEKNWFAGTCDIVCKVDGKLYVGDIKTSSAIYPEHFLQASAYAKALEEMAEYPKFDGTIILNCKKDGSFNYQFNFDMDRNWECFKACIIVYRQLIELRK